MTSEKYFLKISNANIAVNKKGASAPSKINDVCFSGKNGTQETQHVFIESNKLNERWTASSLPSFHIGETGFGAGLNFLVAAQQFITFRKNHPASQLSQLYFFSTEKYPLTKADLKTTLALWPELATLSESLVALYPMPLSGLHRIHLFANQVVLDLWLGDATEGFTHAHAHQEGRIDAWFLDDFAPSNNESMWQPSFFKQIKRLSRNEATFATLATTEIVKQGFKDVGFALQKRKGLATKPEMLVGSLTLEKNEQVTPRQTPVFHRHPPTAGTESLKQQHVAIIGGGIAAAICALKLIRAGKKVSLFCADKTLAQGASGNEQGGFYPQLNAEAGIASQIHAHSFLYARQFYDQLLLEGYCFGHQWCGVLQLCFSDSVTARYQNMMRKQTWPQSLVDWVEPEQASSIANLPITSPSLYLPLGGWLSPPDLVSACIDAAGKGDFNLYLQHRLVSIVETESQLEKQLIFKHLEDNSEATVDTTADVVVLACGAESHLLSGLDLPFRMTRGQVERVPTNTSLSGLSTVLCHKGYMTPAHNEHHAMGSTYVKNDMNTEYRESEGELNLRMHQQALNNTSWSNKLALNKAVSDDNLSHDLPDNDLRGRAAIRCSLPDHLPVVGAFPLIEKQKTELGELYKAKADDYYPIPSVQSNVYLLTGLGSRGLTTAPLMAEILVSQLCSAPLPLDNRLLNAINPNRFVVRDLIRRR
ncbi:MAG: tRNA 5-methylaminomethyl-2-thiouridine biosynthesis bifunctional protein [Bermanella sp.]